MLKLLFNIIIIVILFRLVGKFVIKHILKSHIPDQMRQPNHYQNKPIQEEGEIIIEKPSAKRKKSSGKDDEGEYVDYEEIK